MTYERCDLFAGGIADEQFHGGALEVFANFLQFCELGFTEKNDLQTSFGCWFDQALGLELSESFA